MRIKKQITNAAKFALAVALINSLCQSAALADTWYPSNAKAYPGTAFHCDLQPLPPDMPGIKTEDRQFVDHACAVLLKCAQEKELMLTALSGDKSAEAFMRYKSVTEEQLRRIMNVAPPTGLESFKLDVVKAITLQMTFFDKAVKARASGASMTAVMAIPEGRQASSLLFAAWDEMQKRYWFFWSGNTKDAIYHHLCAFDLF